MFVGRSTSANEWASLENCNPVFDLSQSASSRQAGNAPADDANAQLVKIFRSSSHLV
jgi:hypothetical protein